MLTPAAVVLFSTSASSCSSLLLLSVSLPFNQHPCSLLSES
jgi:hypothetical protein